LASSASPEKRGKRPVARESADWSDARVRQPEVADLAGLDQLGHRADGLLDRDRLVDPMLVGEVDVVHAQPLERGVARPPDVVRAAVDAHPRTVGVALDRTSDQALVGERPVHVGRVEERDAQVEGAVDGVDPRLLVGGAVELRHPRDREGQGVGATVLS
jgi:hypothetical protein